MKSPRHHLKWIPAAMVSMGLVLNSGCSSPAEGDSRIPSPLVGPVVQLRETLTAKQDEMDVATDLSAAGKGRLVAVALRTSMDDIIPVANRIASVAEGSPHADVAKAVAADAQRLAKDARKGARPDSLKQACVSLELQLASLESEVKKR